jgi:hypothetical protein
MDRLPKPAPFAVGTRVRYLGDHATYADEHGKVPLIKKGMEFEIIETDAGRRGTLRTIDLDEEGEAILDTTQDGRSVYVNARGQRRCIWPDSAVEWEIISISVSPPCQQLARKHNARIT